MGGGDRAHSVNRIIEFRFSAGLLASYSEVVFIGSPLIQVGVQDKLNYSLQEQEHGREVHRPKDHGLRAEFGLVVKDSTLVDEVSLGELEGVAELAHEE